MPLLASEELAIRLRVGIGEIENVDVDVRRDVFDLRDHRELAPHESLKSGTGPVNSSLSEVFTLASKHCTPS